MKHTLRLLMVLLCCYNPATFAIDQEAIDLFNQATQYGTRNSKAAIDCLQKSLAISPENAAAHFNLGILFSLQNNFQQAEFHYRTAVEQGPTTIRTFRLAKLFHDQQRLPEAIEYYKKTIELCPTDNEARINLAALYRQQGDRKKAQKYLLDVKEETMSDQSLLTKLGYECYAVDLPEKSLTVNKLTAKLHPHDPVILFNTACSLSTMGEFEQAVTFYEGALTVDPDFSLAAYGLSKAYLALGDYEKGWALFENRFANEIPSAYKKLCPKDLAGKRILILAESWGLGDFIQFIRYTKLAHDAGASVAAQVPKALMPLLFHCDFIDLLMDQNHKPAHYDFAIPLLSLPYFFKTTVNTVPTPIPYLKIPKELLNLWQNQLSSEKKMKIGLCWQCSKSNDPTPRQRALPITTCAPLSTIEGVQFYSLCKDKDEDLTQMRFIKSFGDDLDTVHGPFMDTAAIIQQLDLVITVDTSIAHLAGALGAPVWMLLPSTAEFRWMTKRSDSPWYPTMRLFRQPKPGDWDSAIQEVVAALKEVLENRKTV